MNNRKYAVSDGELFKDFQETLAEISLIELLPNWREYQGRLEVNRQILETIKDEIRRRFSTQDIVYFLNNGYPRQVNLGNRIKE